MKEEAMKVVQPILAWLTEKGVDYALDVAAALVILSVGAIAIRIFSAALHKAIVRTDGRHALASRFIVSVLVKTAWAFLILTVLGKLGVNVGPLIAGLGVTGFILGFAFQESLGSLASGLMIAINEPFKVGDYVAVADLEGTVLQLDMMAVTLATPDNRRITIPNKAAWGSPIVNYSALATRRVEVPVRIGYGADIALARRTAIETVAGIPGVLTNPAPMAEVKSLNDSAIDLSIRMWVANPDYWSVFFAANQAVKEAFAAKGIQIPYPQIDVHVDQKTV